jgi:hypothetical protein
MPKRDHRDSEREEESRNLGERSKCNEGELEYVQRTERKKKMKKKKKKKSRKQTKRKKKMKGKNTAEHAMESRASLHRDGRRCVRE